MNGFIITHFNYFNITHFNYKNAYLDRNLIYFARGRGKLYQTRWLHLLLKFSAFFFCRVLELYCKFVIIGSRMKELFTGLWNNWLAWRRHLLLSTESLRTWWSGDINITFWHCWISCCNTISDNTFKKVQFIVKLTSWYFRSRCPPDFALSLSLFQRHGYAFTWPIKHWSSFGLKLEDSWDTGEPSLGGSSLSISRENVWLVFFLL